MLPVQVHMQLISVAAQRQRLRSQLVLMLTKIFDYKLVDERLDPQILTQDRLCHQEHQNNQDMMPRPLCRGLIEDSSELSL